MSSIRRLSNDDSILEHAAGGTMTFGTPLAVENGDDLIDYLRRLRILEHPRHEQRPSNCRPRFDENASQLRRGLRVTHEPFASPLRFKPPAA
jgi:hypothetical protein